MSSCFRPASYLTAPRLWAARKLVVCLKLACSITFHRHALPLSGNQRYGCRSLVYSEEPSPNHRSLCRLGFKSPKKLQSASLLRYVHPCCDASQVVGKLPNVLPADAANAFCNHGHLVQTRAGADYVLIEEGNSLFRRYVPIPLRWSRQTTETLLL